MRRGGLRKLAPGHVVPEAENHERIHHADERQADHHAQRDVPVGVTHVLRDGNGVLGAHEEPRGHAHGAHNRGGVGGQGGGLVHYRPGPKLECANEAQHNHRDEQQVGHEVLELGKDVDALERSHRNNNRDDRGVDSRGNCQRDGLHHHRAKDCRLDATAEDVADEVASHHRDERGQRAKARERVLHQSTRGVGHEGVKLCHAGRTADVEQQRNHHGGDEHEARLVRALTKGDEATHRDDEPHRDRNNVVEPQGLLGSVCHVCPRWERCQSRGR